MFKSAYCSGCVMHNILVIEDNKLNRQLMNDFIELIDSDSYNIINVENGLEALKKVDYYKLDLILLDIQLPLIDGLELLSKFKEKPNVKNTPIIAVTAYAMEGDREKFLNAGCDEYLPKPLDVDDFEDKIKKFLD
ncbi:response regulator receiver protein [Methanohalobium evestigatum Z-7303]|uniref:Response regulator receiver protein n=2 Tax=Methanohalobium evestigatum TaxID=2322 RepID=D7EA29_METEZ|nr:response regulator receiver protein [Methanohalobium evestigatum Z-7303]